MKSFAKKYFSMITLCVVMLFAVTITNPISVQAATKTVQKLDYSTKLKTIKKKATKVKKGTTTLKGTQGWLKFTAKKTKKYTFTFSNVKAFTSKYDNAYGHIDACYQYRSSKYLRSKRMSTQGGKSYSLSLTTKTNYYSGTRRAITNYTSLPTRSTSFKVKKGQTFYFYFYFAGGPVYFDMNIK